MPKPIIKIENLSKQYRLGVIGTGTLSHDLNRWWARMRGKPDPFLKIGEENKLDEKGSGYVWALRDINLEVEQGEVLGIIGKNGAGKSTLLKILSRITTPTTGRIEINGRLASLLEVGTGFHKELTGRENIFINGAILGMTKAEIKAKLDEIVAFAGVEKYIDTPVKRYSSGMNVRLGFAVAAHLEPEILVVDEVLAVGDAEFQKKAIGKMQDVSKSGRTVLFVSHNMASVENLCPKTVLLENGRILNIDKTETVISQYLSLSRNSLQQGDLLKLKRKGGNGLLKFKAVQLIEVKSKKNVADIQCGSDIIFRIFFEKSSLVDFQNLDVAIGINNHYDQRVCLISNRLTNHKLDLKKSDSHVDIEIKKIPLNVGLYNATLFCSVNGAISDWIQHAFYFNVFAGDFYKTGREIEYGNGMFLLNFEYKA